MTTVHISLGRDDGTTKTAAKGVVEWEPTTRREDGTMVILERGFTVPLVAGEASVTVDPSGLTWCWRVTERTDSGGVVRYVSVPDSAVTVEYVDLPDVDPTTLVAWSPADPEAAYQTALDAIGGGAGTVITNVTLSTAAQAIDMPAATAGDVLTLVIVADGGTPDWDASIAWDAGIAPTLSTVAGERDVVTCLYTGTDWLGFVSGLFAAAPAAPDAIAPTAGTLTVTAETHAAITVSVAGATDETALHATPYAYSSDNGGTYSAYQAGATYEFTGLTASTSYTVRHRVRDAAGNVTVGTAVVHSTDAAPADVTAPTVGTLAGSLVTETSFTLTISGASDETALHATPYDFSLDNGATWTGYQAAATYNASGLTADTTYTCKHRVRDAALNVSTGTAITVTTSSASIVLTDDFTGTDGAITGRTTTTGSKTWLAPNGAIGPFDNTAAVIASNRMVGPGAASGGYNRVDTGLTNFKATISYSLTASLAADQVLIGARQGTGSTGVFFRIRWDGSYNAKEIMKVVDGVETSLSEIFTVPQSGTVVMTVNGNQITLALGAGTHTVTYAAQPTQTQLVLGAYGSAAAFSADNLVVESL